MKDLDLVLERYGACPERRWDFAACKTWKEVAKELQPSDILWAYHRFLLPGRGWDVADRLVGNRDAFFEWYHSRDLTPTGAQWHAARMRGLAIFVEEGLGGVEGLVRAVKAEARRVGRNTCTWGEVTCILSRSA